MKTKRRLLSLLIAGTVLFSTMPVNALAVGNPDPGGPCEHHREHTAECGYTEGEEGSPCTHEHTEDCYILTTKCVHEHDEGCYPEDSVSDGSATPSNAEEREPENCPHVCSEESSCITKELDCQHEHDGDCGYIPASEGTLCTFVCGICNPADSGKEESGKTEDTELEDTIPENTETEAIEPEDVETEDTNLCTHHKEHTEDCCFVPATEDSEEGSSCTYECRICPIEDLIAALPDDVTADNAEDVRARLDKILALYTELDEEEQGQINLSRCMELQEALDAANAPVPAEGEVSADYRKAEWNGSTVTYSSEIADSCTPVENSAKAVTWDAEWYVVNSTVTISEPITVEGNVSLILADGYTLHADKGIVVPENNSLTIYAQAEGTGALYAKGVFDDDDYTASAGIGGSATAVNSGDIAIHGGSIYATGGGKDRYHGAAGIGGGVPYSGDGGNSGTIEIYGGTVTADSGKGNNTSAGIGGGTASSGGKGGDGSNITIYGGTVTATSRGRDNSGAGIGGGAGDLGNGGAGSNIEIHGGAVTATGGAKGAGIGGGAGSGEKASGSGSDITISGGVVTAVGGQYAAGIGGGGGFSNTFIGTTQNYPGGTGTGIEITGGIVDAKGGAGNSSGEYKGNPIGNGGNVNGDAADVDKADCIIFENGEGRVYGAVNLTETYAVPAGYSLTISSGAELEGTGTLTGGGKFWIEDITEDMISVPEGWHYTSDNMAAEIEAEVSLKEAVEICGKTFHVKTEGWELSVAKVTDLEYTVTYAHTDKTPVTKTVTLDPATTTLSGVAAYKADGTTQATTFGANETIIVKSTSKIEANAAVAAASFAAPIAKQMALFVGNTQVSEAVDAVGDTYTMEASAADVLKAAPAGADGKSTLIAKFVGNNNMADAEAHVQVTVTPNPLTAEMVTLDTESVTYNGQEQKPTVTVSGLTVGTDYDVTFQDGFKNAGTYEITVTGKGIYAGEVKKTFFIGKANLTVEGTGTASGTYGTALSNLVISGLTAKWNNQIVAGTWAFTNSDQVLDAGNHTCSATFTPQTGKDNYEPLTADITVTIHKASGPAAPTVTGSYEVSKDKTKFVYTVNIIQGAEYSMDNATWQDSPVFDGIEPDSKITFYARIKGTDNVETGATGNTGEVTFNKLPNNEKPPLSLSLKGENDNRTITITTVEGAEYSFDGGATYGPSNVKIGCSGIVTVTIRYAETVTQYASQPTKEEVDTNKQQQTNFAISPVESKIYGDAAFTLSTTGGNGSGGVTFESSNPNVLTISGTTATIQKAGTVTITARKAADNNYNEAVATLTLTIGKRPITVTADSFTVLKGAAMPTLTYKITSGSLAGTDRFTTDPTLSTATADTNTLGEFAITISGGVLTNGDSYQITYAGGKLVVTDKYRVMVEKEGNGTVSASPDSAAQGETITLTATPDTGYRFKEWEVVSGGVTLNNTNSSTTTFEMLAENVTIKAIFEKNDDPTPPATKYTVTVNGSYSATSGAGSYKATATVTIDAGSRSGYSFNGWTVSDSVTLADAGSSRTTFIMPGKDVTVTANWKYTGSGNNSGDSGSNSGGGNTGGDSIQDAINKATTDANKNGNKENGIAVTVPVDHVADAESLAVTIPAETLDHLIAAKIRRLDITTNGLPCFSFTMDTLKMFDSLPNDGNIILRLSKTTVTSEQAKEAIGTRPVYDFSFVFVKDGKETPITDWKGQTVSIRLPYTPAKDEQAGNLYTVYVDTDGKIEWLTKSSYDADQKSLIFETSHFSIYGVGYKNPVPVFTDITGHWATDNIIFAASRGLLTDTGNNQFSPDTSMTRGMFVTALGRLAGINPESYKTRTFTDVKADAYYAPYVNWAAEKGIMNGTSATTFSPDVGITREQIAVILANYAKKMGYDLPVAHEAVTFADNAQISSWAAKEVKAMQQAGIISGKSDNHFDPKGPATRAEVATTLRRFVEIIIDPQTAQGWMQDHSGYWQYMKDGKTITSWLYDDKKWYWLDQNGKMFAGGFKMIDSKWYYFYSDSMMAANTIIDGYTIGPDGARE